MDLLAAVAGSPLVLGWFLQWHTILTARSPLPPPLLFVPFLRLSLMFCVCRMIPGPCNNAAMRAFHRPVQLIYGILALGWRGCGQKHWKRFHMAYCCIRRGISDAVVLSVHSVVSFSFCRGAIGTRDGIQPTFQTYFGRGAGHFAGAFAMVG